MNNFVHISSSNEVIGSVPHGQPGGGVVEEHTLVTSPHHTPGDVTGRLGLPSLTVGLLPCSQTEAQRSQADAGYTDCTTARHSHCPAGTPNCCFSLLPDLKIQ